MRSYCVLQLSPLTSRVSCLRNIGAWLWYIRLSRAGVKSILVIYRGDTRTTALIGCEVGQCYVINKTYTTKENGTPIRLIINPKYQEYVMHII